MDGILPRFDTTPPPNKIAAMTDLLLHPFLNEWTTQRESLLIEIYHFEAMDITIIKEKLYVCKYKTEKSHRTST